MDKIIIVNKGSLEIVPPTITLAKLLSEQKKDIKIICTMCSSKVKIDLEKKGIKVYETGYKICLKGKLSKIEKWTKFRKAAWYIIDKEYDSKTKLWVVGGDTILALGKKIYKYKYILTLLELYDKNYIYKFLLGEYSRKAQNLVVPEFCRANIMKVWWNLEKRPTVLPNKPYMDDINIESLQVDLEIEKILNDKKKKIILYQGHINKDRDLTNIVKALKKINDEQYVLVLMGRNYENTVEYLQKIYKNIIYLGFIKNPHYFKITKKAMIGIATYDDSSLNHIFCAPNKIYEYAYFGIPILGRDIPGLEYTIGINGAGICVNMDSIESISKGILKIERNYSVFRENTIKFSESVNLKNIVMETLKN